MPNELATIEEIEDILQRTLDELHDEAEKNRSSFNLGKAIGLGGAVLSGIGCIALPIVGIPAVVASIGLYAGSLLSESGTTGEILPIPYSAKRLDSLVLGALQESHGISDDEVEFAEYLPKRDRILYLLILAQGKRLAVMLSQIPKNRWNPVIEAAITRTSKILNHAGTKLDYSNAFNLADGIIDNAEKTLNLPLSRQIAAQEPQKQIVGMNTRLNAVDILSQTVAPQKQAVEDYWDTPAQSIESQQSVARVETTVREMPRNNEAINLAKLIVDNIYSYAIISPSGGGKGMLTSHIVRELKQSRPDMHVFLCDPKNSAKEFGYWDGFVDTWYKAEFSKLSVGERSLWLRQMLEDYKYLPNPKILILDETTAIFSHLKNCDTQLFGEFKCFLSFICSSGNSEENFLMLLGHSPNLSDYGVSGGDFNNFKKVFIANSQYIQAIKQVGTTSFTGAKFGQDVVDSVIQKCKQSPVNRAFYLGVTDQWYPMDTLENFSGYDRDSRKTLAKV